MQFNTFKNVNTFCFAEADLIRFYAEKQLTYAEISALLAKRHDVILR